MKKLLLLLMIISIPAVCFADDDIQKQREEKYQQFKKDMQWYLENKKQEEQINATKKYELDKQPFKNNFLPADKIFVEVVPR